MNNIPVIFTNGMLPLVGYPITGLVFNDDRYVNGTEIRTSFISSVIVMNDDPNRYSAMIVTKSGSKYMVYVKSPSA